MMAGEDEETAMGQSKCLPFRVELATVNDLVLTYLFEYIPRIHVMKT